MKSVLRKATWSLAVGALAVPLVVAVATSWPPKAEVWGPIGVWVAGLPTAGALLVAALAYRSQVEQRHEAALEALRSQAKRVNAWSYVSHRPGQQGNSQDAFDADGDWPSYGLRVSNQSEAPVYDLQAALLLPEGVQLLAEVARVIPPYETFDLPRVASRENTPEDEWNPLVPLVAVRFRDANGRLWVRYANGELELTQETERSGWGADGVRLDLRAPHGHPFGNFDEHVVFTTMEPVDPTEDSPSD